jgi:hypothetical protein
MWLTLFNTNEAMHLSQNARCFVMVTPQYRVPAGLVIQDRLYTLRPQGRHRIPASGLLHHGQGDQGQLTRVESMKPGMFWHVWAEFFPSTDINRVEVYSV